MVQVAENRFDNFMIAAERMLARSRREAGHAPGSNHDAPRQVARRGFFVVRLSGRNAQKRRERLSAGVVASSPIQLRRRAAFGC